jgi:drug/metabolite transporter (DMT)-like permease
MFSSKQIQKGLYFALATSIISGFSVFFNKYAVAAINPPLFFTAIKNIGVGLLLVVVLGVAYKWHLVKTLRPKAYVQLVAVALVGGALPFYLFFTGLSLIPAVNATIIHKTLVIWVALLAGIFLKEKLSPLTALGIGLLVLGQNFVGGFLGFTFSMGEALVLAATLLWSVETVIAKRALAHIDPDIVASARMGLGSLMLLVAALITTPQSFTTLIEFSATQWFWLVATSIFLLGYVSMWYRALTLAPATMVTAVLVLSTLITNVLSAVFVTRVWSATLMLQSLVIALAIVLVYVGMKRQGHTSEFASSTA